MAVGYASVGAGSDVPRAARPNTRLTKAVEIWVSELKLSKAPLTVAGYESDAMRLAKSATRDTVMAFTPELVRAHFIACSEQGNSMATLHRKRAALSEFGKWGVRRKYWPANPVDEMPRLGRPKHLPRPFSRDEIDRLLALELPPVEHLIRALLFFTGLRVTPLCSIKVGDVSQDPPVIRVLVKGRKLQVVRVHPELSALLHDFILGRHPDLKPQSYVIAWPNGRPYHRRTVERFTRAWGVAARVPTCTPHRFRHSFATGLLSAGVDIRVIKEAMGHEDIQSTMIYTQVTDHALDAAIQRLPWGRK